MKVSFFVAAFNFVTVLVVVATTNPAVKSNKKLPSLSTPFQHPFDRRILDEDIDGCDESKCVSTGLSWEYFNNSFTCYAEVGDYALYHSANMMCADGYQPEIVENEPIVYSDFYPGDPYYYFTCCPPKPQSDAKISRHCSNTTLSIGFDNNMICEDNNRPYPRRMKNSTYLSEYDDSVESYICCDSIANQPTNFLNDIECVPYQNKNYEKIPLDIYNNEYGNIYPIYCADPEIGFQYFNENGNCCKTEQRKFVFKNDNLFKATLYPQIFLSAIAVIVCTILIVSLLIPLWLHLKIQSASAKGSTNRTTNRKLRQSAASSTYSSYNLYLVYLAFPDFILNMYLLGMYGSYANQKYNPNFNGLVIRSIPLRDEFNEYGNAFEAAFVVACSTANLYLNCVVSYEILILLRHSDHFVTHTPPSLSRVTLQAVGVYSFSVIVFFIHYFVGRQSFKAEMQSYLTSSDNDLNNDLKKQARLSLANLGWSLFVTYAFPIGCFFYIWMTIKCNGFMPSVTEKTKQLVWFFLRIVFVFCLIWLPGMGFVVTGCYFSAYQQSVLTQVGLLFCGIQPIVSACMAMTKDDIRKYTVKLLRPYTLIATLEFVDCGRTRRR
ncbi:hypothetical protein FRACYDRAFT_256861 [Fragilariopsis cylindrus CCMP1102]|uniref:G-protein coupled receptors family 2 profile 2 domain-containing protein n=1 Tax=Fragilariopsis cylindrus CCMP1102 TaxID=635003 RepID=A0A1E7EJF3_9STRA|nr:hypothetical protein FRACYDRAFT_256861 [Fragilariopsis cylindrus CCMP1102]|eukprot:OEU06015.1 hypothetical protein FRACYDRAFT_256861 [Fragilariopsis cylindrus CCMP1102]